MVLAAPIVKRKQDFYYWRLIATGLSFSLFGLGGLCLRVLVFPLLNLLPGNVLQRRTRSRTIISASFRLFIRFMCRTGIMTYYIEGHERLGRPGQLVIANHPSLIDVVVVIGCIRDANCVVKQSLWENPFTKGPLRAAGYISNDGSMEMLDAAADALRSGQTLVIFPEGTRTTPGEAPEFHRGAAAIAMRGAQCVTPVVITVNPTTLTKAEPWYRIPSRRFHFHLRVGEDLDPRVFANRGPLPIASRRLNEHLHQHFIKELAHERSAT